MKIRLTLAGLMLVMIIWWKPVMVSQSEKDNFPVPDIPDTKRHILVAGKDEKNIGKYHVEGRYVNIKEDSIFVVLTLIDLKGPNKPFKLPPIPTTMDSLKVFYSIETVDIKYEADNVFITGFARGEQVLRIAIIMNRKAPRPGDVT